MTMMVGAAVEDAGPGRPVRLSGFAARTSLSTGVHDPITVRALAVGDTCVIVADVVGLDEDTCAQIRSATPFDDDAVVVAALHNHSGPAVMPGRLGVVDEEARLRIVTAAVRAAESARAARRPAALQYSDGGSFPIATDRRRGGHPSAARLTGLRWVDADGSTICWLASYPCHPVVLGADNTQLSADYPGALRRTLEESAAGSIAVFLTGCCGDLNTGHPALASFDAQPDPRRSFAEADRIGGRLAAALLAAEWQPVAGRRVPVSACRSVHLQFESLDAESPEQLADRWRAQRLDADVDRAAVLDTWIGWATGPGAGSGAGTVAGWHGRVSAFAWGDLTIAFLPGEPFLTGATAVARRSKAVACLVVGYSDGCPGYLPPRDAYPAGGYEVLDAHRYYGMPAPFAAGSAEAVAGRAAAAVAAVEQLP